MRMMILAKALLIILRGVTEATFRCGNVPADIDTVVIKLTAFLIRLRQIYGNNLTEFQVPVALNDGI